jgi:hypothetical protein
MIDEGSWLARACEGALGKAGTGNQQVGVDLEILEGPSQGQHITWYGYFSEASFERTLQSLTAMGWDGTDLSDLSSLGRNEVRVVIEHEVNPDGEVVAKAQWINGVGGIVMKDRCSPDEAKAFAAQMMGRVHAYRQRHPASPAQPAPTNASPTQRAAAPAQQRPTPGAAATPVVEGGPADDIPY